MVYLSGIVGSAQLTASHGGAETNGRKGARPQFNVVSFDPGVWLSELGHGKGSDNLELSSTHQLIKYFISCWPMPMLVFSILCSGNLMVGNLDSQAATRA